MQSDGGVQSIKVVRPRRLLPAIVVSQFAGASLWFAGNAILADLQREFDLGDNAIASWTLEPAAAAGAYEKAQAAGIPVVGMNSVGQGVSTTVWWQYEKCEQGGPETQDAEFIAKSHPHAKVIMLGFDAAESTKEQSECFAKEAKAAGLDIINQTNNEADTSSGSERVFQPLLTKYPEVEAVWCYNDESALGVSAALRVRLPAAIARGVADGAFSATEVARARLERIELFPHRRQRLVGIDLRQSRRELDVVVGYEPAVGLLEAPPRPGEPRLEVRSREVREPLLGQGGGEQVGIEHDLRSLGGLAGAAHPVQVIAHRLGDRSAVLVRPVAGSIRVVGADDEKPIDPAQGGGHSLRPVEVELADLHTSSGKLLEARRVPRSCNDGLSLRVRKQVVQDRATEVSRSAADEKFPVTHVLSPLGRMDAGSLIL